MVIEVYEVHEVPPPFYIFSLDNPIKKLVLESGQEHVLENGPEK